MFFCRDMKTNHYCHFEMIGISAWLEDTNNQLEKEVCGKAMCIECRMSWGDAEKYIIRCKDQLRPKRKLTYNPPHTRCMKTRTNLNRKK
mmetsp:Transcript_257/g.255  ORF Transcript_257/g.255 Transcript_257/m.255 type:complete len:89 (+) Transcript_257:1244-1510(+)